MNTKRFISFSTILLTTVSSVFSQCIIAGTDFDTEAELCCPVLTSDNEEDGWYNENLNLGKLCKTASIADLESAKQVGIGGVLNSYSNSNIKDIDNVFHLNTLEANGKPAQYGYSVITAQPKMIHPFCKANEESNNMLVNIGSAPLCPVISYTVYGLDPGTTAELSFTLYNLLDPTYFDFLVNEAKVTKLGEYITKYNYSSSGSINGNTLEFGVVSSNDNIEFNTTYNNAIELSSLIKATTAKVAYGKFTTVTHKAKVPENGNITFYFYRNSDCFQIPIGIDDIKVTGNVRPLISAKGNPCPMQPTIITSKQNYPEGTEFSWKEAVTGQTSSNASFSFTPVEADADYRVTLEVTMPGCQSFQSETLNVHSGTCCTSDEGVPLAKTYLYYDDFGNFISDDMYEWTDRYGIRHTEKIPAGQVHTSMSHSENINIPYVKAYNIENSGATLAVPALADHPNNADCGGPATELYCHGVYAISKYGGYPGGVPYDNSGTKTGGMLQFDLLDDGTQDDFFEIDIDHICTGKEVSFGVDFASISEFPGAIEVKLECNGQTLTQKTTSVSGGSDGWKNINETFIIKGEDVNGASEVTLKMKIGNYGELTDGTPIVGDTRDYAIDNIFFSICTPPDIAIDYSLNTNKDLLDLNTEDVLTLNAVTSDAMSKFYTYTNGKSDPSKKIGYVYQYTFQDPSTETEINRIKWHTIHKEEVVETKSFDVEFEKYWDEISSNMTDNTDLIYFRVVAGEYSDLIADQSWKKTSALSPCRKVSISYIPVVAKVNYVPSTTMTYLYYDDFGKFVSDSTYEWTDKNGEIHTEQIPAGQTHTSQSISNIKIPYVKAYYLENSGATLAVPLIGTDPKKTELYNIGVYAVSKHGGYPGGVKYDNSGTQTGGMLQFDLLDDGSQDEFFKVDFDHICTDQEIAFGVDFASISLHPGSIEVKLECNGKTLASKTASVSGGSDGWKTVNGKFTLNSEDVDGAAEATITMKISNTLTTTTGEGRDYAIDNIYFAVAGLDCGATTCKDIKNTVDNTNKIEYYKKDAKKDSLKSLDQQNDAVFKAALATTGYTLKIGIVEDATEATAPDLKSAKLGTASSTIPVPTIKDVNSKDDEYLWYYTYLESAEGCVSDTVLVGVIINGEETSLTNTPAKAVSITPNPASTKVSVIAEEAVEKVEILNMVGEVVKVSNRNDIDTSNLSNGVYFVRTTVNDETTVHKLVINK